MLRRNRAKIVVNNNYKKQEIFLVLTTRIVIIRHNLESPLKHGQPSKTRVHGNGLSLKGWVVIGFAHTHPDGDYKPTTLDIKSSKKIDIAVNNGYSTYIIQNNWNNLIKY